MMKNFSMAQVYYGLLVCLDQLTKQKNFNDSSPVFEWERESFVEKSGLIIEGTTR